MTYKAKSIIMATLVLGVAMVSCKKGFHDINDNPNNITDGSIHSSLILPLAMHNAGAVDAAGNSVGYNWLNKWMGYWSNSGSFSPTQEESTYNLTGTFLQAKWALMYNYLNDFYIVEQRAPLEEKHFYAGIAMTMKARSFQDLVDIYGNIPYSQALQLAKYPTPAYDKAEDIYSDLQKVLDSAISIFKNRPAPADVKTVDIMYQGDKDKWIRFANTLKLRLLIRQSEVPGFDPSVHIAKIVANGGVMRTGESAAVNPGYQNATNKQSPYYATFGLTVSGNNANEADRANAFILGILKANNDPRMSRYFRPAATPTNPADPYVGTVYGSPNSDTYNSARTSPIGPGLANSASQPQWILTSVEALFLYAEAVARGWFTDNAENAYNNAVAESFIWLGVTMPGLAAFGYVNGNPSANWANSGATTAEKVRFIVYQKYLSLVGLNPLEAWSDYRRLGVPTNVPLSVDPDRVGSGLPVRLLYPTTEYAVNSRNVQAQGPINQFTSKIFWDR